MELTERERATAGNESTTTNENVATSATIETKKSGVAAASKISGGTEGAGHESSHTTNFESTERERATAGN